MAEQTKTCLITCSCGYKRIAENIPRHKKLTFAGYCPAFIPEFGCQCGKLLLIDGVKPEIREKVKGYKDIKYSTKYQGEEMI